MFAAHCETHGRRVLLEFDAIRQIRRTDRGFTVDFRCSCGTIGRHTITRRGSR